MVRYGARMRSQGSRLVIAATAASVVVGALAGCSAAQVKQATDLGSSVASSVSSGVKDISGGSIQQGMANVAGGIDGALNSALKGAKVTSDGTVANGYPSSAVPLVDGTVLGGGAGPNGIGWVVQVRVASLDTFGQAQQLLTAKGFANGTSHSDATSAFGLFTSDAYRVVLTMSKNGDGVTATYIVTKK
jgi:hypothetical protein